MVLAIEGEDFVIDGERTNAGSSVEGLLMNARMVQAIVDINDWLPEFGYPDTNVWDAERNVSEFLEALPDYAAHGLNAITVNLQGGNPMPAPPLDRPPWVITAFQEDGSLKSDWLGRLERVLDAAEREEMVVILGLFYFGQDHRLADGLAVRNAVDGITAWLVEGGWRNVIVEIGNESNVKYDHAILRPDRVAELIDRVRSQSEGRLLASTSFSGGRIPPPSVVTASDLVLVHGNRLTPAELIEMVQTIRSLPEFAQDPKPIVINEDSPDISKLRAAVEAGVSWGYYEKGEHNYADGFQAPPVQWSINTEAKRDFFEAVSGLTSPASGGY